MRDKNFQQMKYISWICIIAIMAGIILSACNSGQVDETPDVEIQTDESALSSVVSATGIVVPKQFANLSFNTAGSIEEVLVTEGETVQAGQPLVRLVGGDPENPSPELQALIQARELEVEAAEKAMNNLDEQANQRKLQAEQVINDSASQIRDLQYRLQELDLPEDQQELSPLEGYDAALAAYQRAEEAFAPYRGEPTSDTERSERLEDLDAAKEDYDTAVTRLQLTLALEIAEANQDQARQDWEKYQNGPTAEELLDATKQLNSAKANLEAAQAALETLTLVAPFSGTVSEIFVRPGEWASPGMPAVTLADLSTLFIETTDLNEIDITQVAVGDPVQISFDALAETMIDGKVTYIANKASPGAGVNYKVIIAMDTIQEALRWGMSAFVDILPQK